MLSKLIHRPVAVLLTFTAVVVLGVLATFRLPVGLLPEVGIPRLSVQLTYPNAAARTVENSVIAPLRQTLLQVSGLQDIHSRAYDERGIIFLDFPFGTNPDLAFIEVNELVDRSMNLLPRDLSRPRVLATDISDLPVVDLAISLKRGAEARAGATDLLELSELARRLFRRRLEQLPEIAFADLSGQLESRIVVQPNRALLESLAIEESAIATLLTNANLETGNLMLADGHYVFNVRLSNRLRTVADLEKLALNSGGRIFELAELAEIRTVAEPPRGYFFQDDRPGIVFSLRKKAAARLFDLRENLGVLLDDLRQSYPQYDFQLTNDQTAVLTASIDNLRTGLLYGAGFAILVLFAFFREWRRPLLIGLAVPVALLIALLGFYLTGLSVNVISLAGLILGLGLMIDNSIIVLDNIRQLRSQGFSALEAARRGADEVIRPLISSALTTVAVFLPLVLLSGVAGALFRDQAIAVSLSLTASLLVAYFLLPLLSRGKREAGSEQAQEAVLTNKVAGDAPKELGRRLGARLTTIAVLLISAALAYALVSRLELSGFPTLSRTDYRLEVDWNRSISLAENRDRSLAMTADWRTTFGGRTSSGVGEHRFLLDEENRAVNATELRFFLTDAQRNSGNFGQDFIRKWRELYPEAIFRFTPLPNLFDRIFAGGNTPPLLVKARDARRTVSPDWSRVEPLADALVASSPGQLVEPPRSEVLNLSLDYAALQRSRVDAAALRNRLLTIFSENEVTRLREGDRDLAIVLGQLGSEALTFQQLRAATVRNRDGNELPVSKLLLLTRQEDYKVLTADRAGEYVGLELPAASEATPLDPLRRVMARYPDLQCQLAGTLFNDRARIQELLGVLLVSLLLLYLILAAQFESLRLPLVVLLVVPVSLVGSLAALWLLGSGLNLVSLIGMVVTGGIVVNDAIIKLEMIQRGQREMGLGVRAAIQYANRRRLRAILMTSLTTILALAPVLFTTGLGAELQQPLAVAVIGGLVVGTIASLYFLPVVYVALRPKREMERSGGE